MNIDWENIRDSQRLLQLLFQQSNDGILVHVLHPEAGRGKFLMANQAACTLLGYTSEELCQRSLVEITAPEYAEAIQQDRSLLEQTGSLLHEKVLLRKDGSRVPVEINTSIFPAFDQRIVVSVIRDISRHKQVESALKESEARFRALFEGMSEGFALHEIVCDEQNRPIDYRFLEINTAFERLTGLKREGVVGQLKSELLPDDDTFWIELYGKVALTGQPIHFENYSKALQQYYEVFAYAPAPRQFAVIFMNITERRKAEELRREQEEQYRLLFKTMQQGVVYQAADGTIISMNPAAERILGKSRMDFLGQTSQKVEHHTIQEDGSRFPGDQHPAMIALQTGQELRDVVMGVYNPREKRYRWISISAVPLFRPGETRPYQVYTIFDDITSRREAEQALQESQQRFRVAMASVPLLVYTCDRDLRYTWVYNPMHGFHAKDVLGKRDDEVLPPEAAAELVRNKQHALDTGESGVVEVRMPFDDGLSFYILTMDPIKNTQGEVVGLTCAALDVTVQRQMEAEQRETSTQMEVQRRLMEYRERERQEIARELHDGPIQITSGAIFHLQAAKQAAQDPEIRAEVDQAIRNLKAAVRDLRDVVNNLRPPSLLSFGLTKSAKMHAEDLRDKHPQLHLSLDMFDDQDVLGEQTCLALFRIYQEALNNVMKHSAADQVWVRLFRDGDAVVLEIEDNGQGFSVTDGMLVHTLGGHYGLAGMRERAEAVGGTLEIISRPNQGTKLRVRAPLQP